MIRWKGVLFLLILVALIFILSLIFTDRWLENQLERVGSQIVGAKVEIEDLDFSFFGAHLKIAKLQVTNPKHTMRNLLETGACELNFEFWPLLSKKIIVENFQIHNVRYNTPRKTDGALPEKLKKESKKPNLLQKSLQKVVQNIEQNTALPLQNAKASINITQVIKTLELQSPKKIDSLQKALSLSFERWQKRLQNPEYQHDLQEIEKQLKQIDPQKIKDLKTLQRNINTLKSIRKKLTQLSDSITITKNALQTEISNFGNSLSLVDDWIAQDYQKALAKAKLPEFSRKNIARMLFGATVVSRFEQYLAYIQSARYYLNKMKSNKPKKQKPPRLKGQDIYFFSPHGRPDFWIKKASLSGQTNDGLQMAGIIKDIISDQRFIKRPTTIKLESKSQTQRFFRLTGQLNYLQEVPQETFEVNYRGFSLNNTKISNSPYLPAQIRKGIGQLSAQLWFKGDTVNSKIYFEAKNLQLELPSQANLSLPQKLVFETLNNIKKLNLKARVLGQAGHWKININSNLDDLLLQKFKEQLSAQFVKAKKRLRQEIEKKIKPEREKFLSFVHQKQAWLTDQIQKQETTLKKLQNDLKQRQQELEKRVQEEKKKAGKQLQDKIKGWF